MRCSLNFALRSAVVPVLSVILLAACAERDDVAAGAAGASGAGAGGAPPVTAEAGAGSGGVTSVDGSTDSGTADAGGGQGGHGGLTIAGVSSKGSTLTISGSGFGTKNPAAPVLWDTVDNQPSYAGLADGDEIPVGAPHPWGSNGSPWAEKLRHSTSRPHRGSRTAHYHGPPGAHGDAFIGAAQALKGGTQRTLYVNWWYRPAIAPDTEGGSNKFIRIWDDPSGTKTRISWTQMHMTYGGVNWASWTSKGNVGDWNNHEILVDSDRGEISVWLNTSMLHHVTDFVKNPTADSHGLYIGLIGFDHGNSDYKTQHTEVSEIYVDTSRARVFVGNASTFESSTHREIQIPTSWSETEVQVTVNLGELTSLSGNYLYVITADGAVSAPYLLN